MGKDRAEWDRNTVLASVILHPWLAIAEGFGKGKIDFDPATLHPYMDPGDGTRPKVVPDMEWKDFIKTARKKKR